MTDIEWANINVTSQLHHNSTGPNPLSELDEFEKELHWEHGVWGCSAFEGFAAGMRFSEYLVSTSFFIFFRAGDVDDWCLQDVCVGESVIFGGYNRVAFICDMKRDPYWYAHTTHCRPQFLEGVRNHCPWVVIPGGDE